MTTITNEKLVSFCFHAKAFINSTPKSKLWFACDKILRIALKKARKTDQEKDERRRENALMKDKGLFDLDDKNQFQFTKESEKKLLEEFKVIDEKTIELETHIVTDFDDSKLSYDMRTAFEGIVIPEYKEIDIDNYQESKEQVK